MSYAAQIALAKRLIAKKGAACVLRHVPTGAPARDRLTDAISDDGTVVYSGVMIVTLKYKSKGADQDTEPNTSTLSRLRKFLISGASCPVMPQTPDTITGPEGRTWIVKNCSPLAPDGGTAILYSGVMES